MMNLLKMDIMIMKLIENKAKNFNKSLQNYIRGIINDLKNTL